MLHIILSPLQHLAESRHQFRHRQEGVQARKATGLKWQTLAEMFTSWLGALSWTTRSESCLSEAFLHLKSHGCNEVALRDPLVFSKRLATTQEFLTFPNIAAQLHEIDVLLGCN